MSILPRRIIVLLAGLFALLHSPAPSCLAVGPGPDEMLLARQFAATRLEGAGPLGPPSVGLEVVANYDAVQKNCRFGKPLRLGGNACRHGLFCHAPSKIVVRLPGPGRTFEASAGVDSNEQTSGGRGSVVFVVSVDGKELYRSPLERENVKPAAVRVDLAGARQFVLEVSDGGDGISCDQADWADARVTLTNGRTLALDGMPLVQSPMTVENQTPPFSFTFGGQRSNQLLGTWHLERTSRNLDANRTERTLSWTDPKSGLVVRCVSVEYRDFPVVEWTVYFKNSAQKDSPLLENIQAIDLGFQRGHYGEFLLHHAVGSPCAVNDYQPLARELAPKTEKRISAAGGRPTNSDLSYFNLEIPTGQGVIVAVGWPGQWSSRFIRDDALGLRMAAGQELTHFKLLPGEEVRSPLVALLFWDGGDWLRAQNLWRRWMLAHNVPKPDGKLPSPELFGCSSHLFSEMQEANEANQKDCIDRYLAERIKIDRWWMDAGWYPFDKVGWPKTGTWEVDTKRFPRGLRAISDHAHSNGVKTIVWFEPERVHPGTWLTEKHPEWILGGAKGGLLDLGNPDARRWLTDHVDRLMVRQGIDLYRQDFNMDPLDYWRANDAPDRQGITEIRHVEGYLAWWDELLRRHPGMFIDTCASGGRRNDLETLRRAIPLWRTDYRCEPVGTQCCTYGISLWIPLSGTGAADVDTYIFRSNMAPFTNCLFDVRNRSLDYDQLRRLVSQWRQVADCYLGDFYPLTEYTTGRDGWMAWQFDLPGASHGMVQAFRRDKCIFEVGRLKLHGLEPDARYAILDLDTDQSQQMTGRQLMEKGFRVTISDQPGSAIYMYRKLP